MPKQILNEMYSLRESIKTSEDLIDFLEKAKPLYLKGLELCDKLDKISSSIDLGEIVHIGDSVRNRTLWSILDLDLDLTSGLCELRISLNPNNKLYYWDKTLYEAIVPEDALFYKNNNGLYQDSKVPEIRQSFSLRIELIDKMLVIAKSKYNER